MKNSLKKHVNQLIKEKNPNLIESKIDSFSQSINEQNNWYIIVFIIFFFFFIIHLINIPFLNFIPIEEENIKTLINNRTTNIVTMISVTFAVIGFLIANLAIKESFTYNILFKKSGFFPVAFTALTLIVCFILLSTFTDWFPLDYQRDALLVGTYFISIVIFLIGYLFTNLVRFTNQKYILDLVQKKLISESKRNLFSIGQTIISLHEVQKLGLYNYSRTFVKNMTKGDFILTSGYNVVSDIKINKLSRKIGQLKHSKKIFINNLFLNREIVGNEDGLFFVEETSYQILKQDLKELNKCIVISKKSKETYTDAKEYILQKLEENVKSNNHKLVEKYLNMLSEAYELQQTFKV